MEAFFKRFSWVVLVATGLSQTAAAEDLVMPFSCTAQDGAVQIAPSAETAYRIVGARQEQIFAACRGGGTGNCENHMVHRFTIQCGNAKVSWAQVVQAASRHGIEVPQGLPQGYAPAGALKARFVFPALARFNIFRSEVETEPLSADGVEGHEDGEAATRVAAWRTEVRADIVPQSSSGAFRVAAIVSFLMMLLLSASLIAAGRWRLPQLQAAALRRLMPELIQRFALCSHAGFARAQASVRHSFGRAWDWMRGGAPRPGGAELTTAAAVAMAPNSSALKRINKKEDPQSAPSARKSASHGFLAVVKTSLQSMRLQA